MFKFIKRRLALSIDPSWLKDVPYWAAALTTGLIAVGFASMINYAEKLSQDAFTNHPVLFLVFGPVCFIIAWALVHFFAPAASGSGIPQVMAAIEAYSQGQAKKPDAMEKLLGLKTALVKVLSSTICVMGGGAVGREGPTIQIAATVFHLVRTRFGRFTRELNAEFWLITGGGAGIAAAFNTPLGGLVYSIEELATAHFNRFKVSLISSVILAGIASQWVAGSYLYIGYPVLFPVSFKSTLWAIFVGIIAGAAGGLFSRSLIFLAEERRRIKGVLRPMLLAGGCGLVMALLAWLFDPHALGPGRETVLELLFSNKPSADWKLIAVRFVGPLLSYVSGAAGGIFAPSLAAGASIGHFLAGIVHAPQDNLFTLLGMIAFLTGVTHAPFTSFVLVLEMTDRHSAIFPMMLAAWMALAAAKVFGGQNSFYEHMKHRFYEAITATDTKPTNTEIREEVVS